MRITQIWVYAANVFQNQKTVINKCRFVLKRHKKRRKIIQITSERAGQIRPTRL